MMAVVRDAQGNEGRHQSGRRRLLTICQGFPPYYGGAEHVAWYLGREAARCGRWEVKVLTSDIGGRLPARETLDGMDIIRVHAPKREWARHTTFELARFLRAARGPADRLVREWRPDVVLAHFSVPAGELARGLACDHGLPYAVVLHGSDVPGYQPERFGWVYPFMKPFVKVVWKRAARVIAVSEPLARLARVTWPEGAITVIKNGVDIDAFVPAEASAASTGSPVRVLAVSQLIERKGLDVLLAALARLSSRVAWTLEVCGTGPAAPALRERAEALGCGARVTFCGLVAHDDLPARMRAADIFALPSLQEGLPLALLEAMSAALPVVATRVGAVPGVIRHLEDGWLVDPGDVAGLAQALEGLAGDVELRRRMGHAARVASARFSWPAVWETYEAALPPVSGQTPNSV